MALNEITDADIREYILGQSPPDKSDRLDELSFDDEHSGRIGAVEREIIDDYVRGGLDPDERSAFESNYLSSPLRRERVQFSRDFAKFADRSKPVAEPTPAKQSIFDIFRQRMFVLQFGAVAMLLIVGAAAWLALRDAPPNVALNEPIDEASPGTGTEYLQSPTPEPPVAHNVDVPHTSPSNVTETPKRPTTAPTPAPEQKAEPPRLVAFVLTPALRSSSFQQVKVPSGVTTVELQLRLETDGSGPLAAEVIDLREGKSVWSGKNVSARSGRDGSIASIRIPVRVLKMGEHQVSISQTTKDGKSEKIGDYFFKIAP